MQNLFKKAACFTDIHYGMRNNSRTHNLDCEEFVKWFCDTAKQNYCETAIFLGDWHHHRATINVSTLNYTVSGIEVLSKNFEHVYMIMGNHDLYYREKREINSVPFGRLWDNVTVVNDIFTAGDVTIVPWLVEDEWRKMSKCKSRYMFGHFELSGFKMNAMVEMPDHGGLNMTHFPNQEYVFSGHFHKRQKKTNVHYIGNAFPHNFADVWDDDRGMMILEWDGVPEYINWPMCPRFITTKLSELMDNTDNLLLPKTHAKVDLDIDITYEEANLIKEEYTKNYPIREIILIPPKHVDFDHDTEILLECETVDKIVINQLQSIESESIKTGKLLEIYNNLS